MKLAKDITAADLKNLGFEVHRAAMAKGRVSVTLEGVLFVHPSLAYEECSFQLDGPTSVRVYTLNHGIQEVLFLGPVQAAIVLTAIQAAVLSGPWAWQ